MQQQIALLQALEHAAATRPLRLRPAGLEGRKAQAVGGGLVDELVQAHQVHRAVDRVQRLRRQCELLQQQRGKLRRAGTHHFQADGLSVVAGGQAGAQGLPQVGHVVLVHLQVGVACDAELGEGLHRAAGQQFTQVGPDHAGQQDKAVLARRHQPFGQADHPRQRPWHLHDDDRAARGMHVVARQAQDEVQALVGHQRERVRRIQRHGHQQRTNLRLEEARHPTPLRLVAVSVVEDAQAFFGQGRHHFVVEHPVLLVNQLVRLRRQVRKLLSGLALSALADELQPVRKAHFEELVQVGRHDGDVAKPLQQRHIGAARLGEHTAVEGQEGGFAIDHAGWACCGTGLRQGRLRIPLGTLATACDDGVTARLPCWIAATASARAVQQVGRDGDLSQKLHGRALK